MNVEKRTIRTCDVLLREFHVKEVPVLERKKLIFTGVNSKDVYNITAPFEDEGVKVLAGRVESRNSEQSQVMFFTERDGVWHPLDRAPILQLQDPFVTRIGNRLIVGGVETFPDPLRKDRLSWRTVFYQGNRLDQLEPFFTGPDGMKDVRMVGLPEGDIGIFTRPQGEIGGLGKIGFFRIPSLDRLTVEAIANAPLLKEQFAEDEWGGVNEARILSNGWVGVLGHIARFDGKGMRHYYPMVFALDPNTGRYTDMEVIAVRASFAPGPAKRTDLEDVVFSGGILRLADGTAALYAGISDAEAHYIVIPDPFLAYE